MYIVGYRNADYSGDSGGDLEKRLLLEDAWQGYVSISAHDADLIKKQVEEIAHGEVLKDLATKLQEDSYHEIDSNDLAYYCTTTIKDVVDSYVNGRIDEEELITDLRRVYYKDKKLSDVNKVWVTDWTKELPRAHKRTMELSGRPLLQKGIYNLYCDDVKNSRSNDPQITMPLGTQIKFV